MELRDLIVTPILIIIVFVVAWVVRPYVTDGVTRRYFLPALTLRVIGALSVGFIYQFYYGGGDTFNFHTHGSRHIWNAFVDSPRNGFHIFLYGDTDLTGVYESASRILFLSDSGSFTIVRLAFLFDIITFSSYSATAVLFSVLSFCGMWMFFKTFYRTYPALHKRLAIASLFIPSVFFWGSGLLKDTVTLGCLGMAVYFVAEIFFRNRVTPVNIFLLILVLFIIYHIKIYILLTFLPAAIVWVFLTRLKTIRYTIVKFVLFPIVFAGSVALAFVAMRATGENDERYSLDKIAQTAQATAYDIRYYSGKDAGSGYTLGELDGSFQSMLALAPAAVNVTLFRPYLWEARNPLMLLSSLESFALLLITIITLWRTKMTFFKALTDPTILFCFVFSIVFAFAVGVSTYNFGTLTRYKIPMMPFYTVAIILIINYANRERNKAEFDATE